MNSKLTTLRILWFALLCSIGFYAAVPFLVVHGSQPQPVMLVALTSVAVVTCALSFLMPAFLYKRSMAALVNVAPRVVERPRSTAEARGFRDASPGQRCFEDPVAARRFAYQLFMTPFILSLALSESVALFGLMLFMLGFGLRVFAAFELAGALLIALRFPTDARVVGWLEKALDAGLE